MILEQNKGVHCVDLGESFQTHIFLQNLASIQPRTSPVKFARPSNAAAIHLPFVTTRRRAGVSVRLAGADVRHHGSDRARGHRRGLRRLGALAFFS